MADKWPATNGDYASLLAEQARNNARLFFKLAHGIVHGAEAAEDVCQQALLKAYANYTIPVYPTHRTVANPQRVYDATRQYANTAALTESGNGISGSSSSTVANCTAYNNGNSGISVNSGCTVADCTARSSSSTSFGVRWQIQSVRRAMSRPYQPCSLS